MRLILKTLIGFINLLSYFNNAKAKYSPIDSAISPITKTENKIMANIFNALFTFESLIIANDF